MQGEQDPAGQDSEAARGQGGGAHQPGGGPPGGSHGQGPPGGDCQSAGPAGGVGPEDWADLLSAGPR